LKIGNIRAAAALCDEVAKLCRIVEAVVTTPEPKRKPLDSEWVYGPHPEQSALRRRSLDLTRALAKMRRAM
jgi:hypothetical protein